MVTITSRIPTWIWKNKSNHSLQENILLFDFRRQSGLIVEENPVLLCSFLWLAKKLASPPQPIRWKKKRVARVFPWLSLRVSSSQFPFLLDTCGSPVIKCLCFSVFFFSSATKWKNGAIVPGGHWALNTMTTNCDPMRCSHADHACYLDDDWRCHAQTGPGHMTNHEIFAYKTLVSRFVFQRIWIAISWSIMAETLKILTDAYTSRIIRG